MQITKKLPKSLDSPSEFLALSNLIIIKKLFTFLSKEFNITTETCDSYTDSNGHFYLAKKCPVYARFCCGTCTKRYCCDTSNRLNQPNCKLLNSTDDFSKLNKKYESFLMLFLFFFLLFYFLV